jgi:hypothetical protein
MKKEIPVPAVIAAIVVVVAIVGFFGFRALSQSRPALVPGGVHVSPPNNGAPQRGMGRGAPGPSTGGGAH